MYVMLLHNFNMSHHPIAGNRVTLLLNVRGHICLSEIKCFP